MFSKLMKRLTAVLLVCALLLPAALAASYPFQGVLTGAAVLRRGTGDGAEALASLPAGDAVYITGESGSYYIAEYDGVTGYLPKAVVSADSINAPTAEAADRYAALRQGDSGQAVTDLQSALTELQYLSGKADGKYGAKTAQAVKDFQVTNGLAASGAADAATQSLLFEGEPLNAKGKKASVTTVPTVEGFPLTKGKKGELVTRVQSSLTVLGYYSGKVDGVYGASTVTAVKKFQQKNGLTATGTADAAVQSLLFGGSPLSASATATPKPTATPSYSANTYLRNGNSGKQVKQMQERLISLGYLVGTATSNFDNATEAAVIAFQRRNTSYADGVAGPETLKALYSSSASKASSPSGIVGITLREGSTSKSAVRLLQQKLKNLGYYTGTVDGDFGSGTTDAVKAFQRDNRITADGVVGGGTLNKLFSSSVMSSSSARATATIRPTVTPRLTPTPIPDNIYVRVTAAPNNQYATLRRGMYGTPVQEMQQALKNQGYFTGVADGYYGEGTENAVKSFQRYHGLQVDGVAGPATLRTLLEGEFPFGS